MGTGACLMTLDIKLNYKYNDNRQGMIYHINDQSMKQYENYLISNNGK